MSEPSPHDALLVLALDCERVLSGSERWSLDATDQVQLGRADSRSARRDRRTLVLGVPDPRMSTDHAWLIRIGERWLIEDRGSKNGTIVNGQPLLRAELSDGDLLEVGRTLFVFRELPRSGTAVSDLTSKLVERQPRPLRTVSLAMGRAIEELARQCEQPGAIFVAAERGSGLEALVRALGRRSSRPGGAAPLVRDLGAASRQEQAEIAALARSGEHVVVCTSERPLASTELLPELASLFAARALELPPLRARREDLGLLIGATLRSANGMYEWAIEPDAARALFRHGWPDNLDELDQMLRRAASLSDDGLIRLEHLPRALGSVPPSAPAPAPPESEPPPENGLRDELCAVLIEHAGNVSRAARALGRDRSSLRRQLARLAIDPNAFRRAMERKKPSDVR